MTSSRPADEQNQPDTEPARTSSHRSALIYCGFCSALNPATNHYCAACGSTLVDAFHASEGLRVFEQPDSASRLVEIVPSGSELEIVDDPDAPEDFVRIRLERGRLGYIRLQEVETLAASGALPGQRAPDINTNARGCVTPGAALGALVLLIVTATLGMFFVLSSDDPDAAIFGGVFCLAVVPLMLITIGLYLYARNREDRLEDEQQE